MQQIAMDTGKSNWISNFFNETNHELGHSAFGVHDASPKIFKLDFLREKILCVTRPYQYYDAASIAELINRPRQYTSELLEEMANAGFLCKEVDKDFDGFSIYGYFPSLGVG